MKGGEKVTERNTFKCRTKPFLKKILSKTPIFLYHRLNSKKVYQKQL